MHRPHRTERGFTLIEMMAVVLIIGLLSGIVGVAVFRQLDKAKIAAPTIVLRSPMISTTAMISISVKPLPREPSPRRSDPSMGTLLLGNLPSRVAPIRASS